MKRLALLLATGASALVCAAQEPADALRFSYGVPAGTARQQAIGGAMGSLGGDFSALYGNPAGLGFYRTNDFVITPMFRWSETKGSFLGRTEKESDRKFDVGALGLVFGSPGKVGSLRGVGFSVGFSNTADFRNTILYRGQNNSSSYSQRFIEELGRAGVRDSTAAYLFPYGPSLAINTFWLDPVKDANGQVTGFRSNSPVSTGLLQQQRVESRGGINEAALGIGLNTNDKLFVGATIGIPFLAYNRKATFTEADATTDTSNRFDFAEFRERVQTTGTGLNLKLGIIYKPAEYWRLGLAVHTPTLYKLTDRYHYELTTNTENYEGEWDDFSKDYNDGAEHQFKYMLLTPLKATASASYVLREIEDVTKQRGFLTADVEYVAYNMMRYMPDNDVENSEDTKAYLDYLNRNIRDLYKGAFNVRVGGELKFTTLMVRAGAAWYGNPYKEVNGGTGGRLNLTGGLGYRHRGYFIDLTYVHSMQRDIHTPYRLSDAPYFVAETRRTQGNVALSFGVKF
ncbi:hypothetical protein [Flaviaesturariibacter amylovorans]